MTPEESLNLSPSEKNAEFQHRVETRLAILTDGKREPSKWEWAMAREEAFKWLEDAALPYSTTAAVNIQGITAEILEPSKLQLDFDKLSKEWYEETGGYSLTMRRYAHSSYQSILALEPKRDVIALILQELQHRPDRWFEALKALTKTNPAQDSKSFNETVQCWIKWGKSENYI